MSLKNREVKPCVGGSERTIDDLFALKDRTILITGGGGAMALEVARSVLESGGDVICIDRQESPLPEPWQKVQTVASTLGTKAWYYQCNTTDVEKIGTTFETAFTHTRFPLRGFVACAGVSEGSPALDESIDTLRRMLDVNVVGTFTCAQAAAREFQKQNVPGSIVLIASMSGHVCNKGVDTAAYNSSKAAVHQLARSLAGEWGSRQNCPLIRVNTISPGYIKTRMTFNTLKDPEIEQQWTNQSMLMRLSEAHEYRGPVMFLLSDASSFVTGADLRVDGGHTAW